MYAKSQLYQRSLKTYCLISLMRLLGIKATFLKTNIDCLGEVFQIIPLPFSVLHDIRDAV